MKTFIVALITIAAIGSALAQTKFLFLVKAPPAPINGAILLEDNASILLLEDNTSNLCLEGGC